MQLWSLHLINKNCITTRKIWYMTKSPYMWKFSCMWKCLPYVKNKSPISFPCVWRFPCTWWFPCVWRVPVWDNFSLYQYFPFIWRFPYIWRIAIGFNAKIPSNKIYYYVYQENMSSFVGHWLFPIYYLRLFPLNTVN